MRVPHTGRGVHGSQEKAKMHSPIYSHGPSALFSKPKQHPQDRPPVLNSAITQPSWPLCGTLPAASWTRPRPVCLNSQETRGGRRCSRPTVHKLTCPASRTRPPGAEKPTWSRRQSTALLPKRRHPGDRGPRLDPGGSLVRLSSRTEALGSASHTREASVVRWPVTSPVTAYTGGKRLPGG